jgi:hypothetical protein
MNFYWGAGKQYNLGLGYNPPLGVSHATIVKYFNTDKDNSQSLFASINGLPFSLNEHPNFEFGGKLIFNMNNEFHSFAAGTWIAFKGNITPTWVYPLIMSDFEESGITPGFFVKYQFSEKNFNISVQNYLGLRRRVIQSYRYTFLGHSEKVIFKNSDIISISYDSTNFPYGYLIQTKEDSFKLSNSLPYVDSWAPARNTRVINRFKIDEGIRAYYLLNDRQLYPDYKTSMFEVDIYKLMAEYQNGNDIILQNNPENNAIVLKKIKWYINDWSVGVGWKYK